MTGAILAALLGEVVRAPGELARPVQVVDATSLGWPGPRKGVAWRIHARLELAPTRFTGFVLTDGSGAERLDRFAPPRVPLCWLTAATPGTAAWPRSGTRVPTWSSATG